MDNPDSSTAKMSPKPENRDQSKTRNASSGSLFNKFGEVLGEKTTNLKRSLPFMASSTSPKPTEKMKIGAPFNARQGAGAMATPPRRPKPGEDARTWGTPDLVDTKPKLPGGIEQQSEAQVTTTAGNSGTRGAHSTSPVHDTMGISEAEQKNSTVNKKSLDRRSSCSITALPRPPASNGLRGLMASAHRLSRLALNDPFPSAGSDSDSRAENAGDARQQQERIRPKKSSIFEQMKNTLKGRRHKRSNTTVQTQVDFHESAPQSSLRTSRSAALLTSQPAVSSERHGGISPPMEAALGESTMVPPELPPINSGPAMTFSSMSLLQSPRQDSRDVSATAAKSSQGSYASRPTEELPAFAKESSMPEGIEVSGHNGFHRMNPLRSHANVMEFAEAPSVAVPARMAAIPEDKAEGVASRSSAVGRATPISEQNAAEASGREDRVSHLSNVGDFASNAMDSSSSVASSGTSLIVNLSSESLSVTTDGVPSGQNPNRRMIVMGDDVWLVDVNGFLHRFEEIPNPVAL
ncbi:hypothetical protein SLS58_009797 [Diplodia intermedia]|uniref:Uncharacterized protein n=1 Tax=Diplodia intermedia TaxID=856260 RepID=A0ABR3TAQ3_9PEZI